MKDLLIHVSNKKPVNIDGLLSCWGEIRIEEFKETFVMPLESWSLDNYESQWKQGLQKIEENKEGLSCFVASAQNITTAPLVNLWALYREKDIIFIQNYLLFSKDFRRKVLNDSFTPENCYDYIPPRTTVSEDGSKISEWNIKV